MEPRRWRFPGGRNTHVHTNDLLIDWLSCVGFYGLFFLGATNPLMLLHWVACILFIFLFSFFFYSTFPSPLICFLYLQWFGWSNLPIWFISNTIFRVLFGMVSFDSSYGVFQEGLGARTATFGQTRPSLLDWHCYYFLIITITLGQQPSVFCILWIDHSIFMVFYNCWFSMAVPTTSFRRGANLIIIQFFFSSFSLQTILFSTTCGSHCRSSWRSRKTGVSYQGKLGRIWQ